MIRSPARLSSATHGSVSSKLKWCGSVNRSASESITVAQASAKLTHKDLKQLDDFPEVRQLIEPYVITPETLAAISTALVNRRDEAKKARQSAGLEAVWTDAEESYVGIDEANRNEWQTAKWTKPTSITGPVTTGRDPRASDARSTVFVRLTARYTDAGAAKLSEILLPPDDRVFTFEPMPEPELIRAKDDQSQVFHDTLKDPDTGQPLGYTRPARADEQARMIARGNVLPFPRQISSLPTALQQTAARYAPAPIPAATQPTMGDVVAGRVPTGPEAQQAPKVPLTIADIAEEHIEMLRKAAKGAEKKVDDWLHDCHFAAEYRKVIQDAAKLGTGVLKGPFPKGYQAITASKDKSGQGIEIQLEEKIKPSACWVNPWNFFPDPACGEDIHDGDYCFERDYLTEKQLRDLKKLPGYIEAAIDAVIAEGPEGRASGSDVAPPDRDKAKDKNRWEIWYYYGTLKRADLACICQAANSPLTRQQAPADRDLFDVIVTMVNDRVVKAAINPLSSGSFPYDVLPWQRRSGSWAGIGVPEQCRTPQRALNAAVRSMMNNAGISAGPQVVIDKDVIEPADGLNWTVTPNKLWVAKQGTASNPNGVKGAFTIFEIPNTTQQLMEIVNYFTQLFEECTAIPLVTQGKQDDNSPETFGATILLNTNANQMIRAIGYASDELVIEPFVRRCYEWWLLDDEVPDSEKAQFRIEAQGSRFVERAISDQAIIGFEDIVLNPAYGYDPIRYGKLRARAARIHPDDLCYSPEELARIRSMPPTDPPPVAAAKIRAAAQNQSSAATASVREREIATDATVKLHEMQTQRDLLYLEYSLKHGITIDQLKAELAGKAMQLNTERELNAQNNAHDMRKHVTPSADRPPVQAPGRAAPGHQFDQMNPQ